MNHCQNLNKKYSVRYTIGEGSYVTVRQKQRRKGVKNSNSFKPKNEKGTDILYYFNVSVVELTLTNIIK